MIRDGNVLLAQRPAGGLLGGLWEFPSAEVYADSAEALVAAIEAEYQLKVTPLTRLSEVRHAYTHFKLTEFPWTCELLAAPESDRLKWIPLGELKNYPMGKVDRTISRHFLNEFS
jgi:adenine-specific DNA glycosylase